MSDLKIEVNNDNEIIYALYSDENILLKKDKDLLIKVKDRLNKSILILDNFIESIKQCILSMEQIPWGCSQEILQYLDDRNKSEYQNDLAP